MLSFRSLFRRRGDIQEATLSSTAHLPQRPPPPNWRGLYVAALLEKDKERMAWRIADAQKALVGRARELFQAAGDNLEEEAAIDDALYALHALEQYTGADASQYAQRQI